MPHLHENDKNQPQSKAAANSPNFQQEGIASCMPPQFNATAGSVPQMKENGEEKEEALQKKENNNSFVGADAPVTPPNSNIKNNAYHSEPKQFKAYQLSVQEKTVKQFKQDKPFQLKKSPADKKSQSGLPQEVQAKMENSMGHDFSNVNIHQNSRNATDAGALAYAQGNDVHFAPGQFKPDTTSGQELIGHELAHVVQQREGRVKPTKMLGKGMAVNDDPKLEKEADDMGRKAAKGSVQMKSNALQMRRNLRGQDSASKSPLQMKKTDYGEFKTPTYEKVSNYGAKIELEFHPNKKVDADKVGLTQTIKMDTNNDHEIFSPTRVNHQTADGTHIDRFEDRNNPVYGGKSLGEKDQLNDTNNSGGNFKLGLKDNKGKWSPAYLYDRPVLPGRGNDSAQIFETAALAIEGTQEDMYYGSVEWGWKVDGKGKYELLPLSVVSKGAIPSEGFRNAAKKWNDSTALGTVETIGDPTSDVFDVTFKKTSTLKKGTVVTLGDPYIRKDGSYNEITDPAGNTGRMKTSDLKDIGDGVETIDLPIPWKGQIAVPANQGTTATLRSGKSSSSKILADLPVDTKLLVINDSNAWHKIQLDHSQAGVSINSDGKAAIDAANLLRGYVSKELIKK